MSRDHDHTVGCKDCAAHLALIRADLETVLDHLTAPNDANGIPRVFLPNYPASQPLPLIPVMEAVPQQPTPEPTRRHLAENPVVQYVVAWLPYDVQVPVCNALNWFGHKPFHFAGTIVILLGVGVATGQVVVPQAAKTWLTSLSNPFACVQPVSVPNLPVQTIPSGPTQPEVKQ